MELSTLTAISPVDGRYGGKTAALRTQGGTQSPAKTHDRGGRPADIATDPHAGWRVEARATPARRVAREKMSLMTRQLETESCKIPNLP